jgi:hypothetical protein
MAKEITTASLFIELKKRLVFVQNLKSVYIGKMAIGNFNDFHEDDYQPRRIPIALGEPELVDSCRKTLIELFAKEKLQYSFDTYPVGTAGDNMLFLVLDVDTSNNYSIDDLDDDDLFSEPFTLIK